MSESRPEIVFDEQRASKYDDRWAKLAPMREALHLLMGRVFAELPDEARILVVGAGTGQELLELARAGPRWRFVAVDPAAPMLAVCRARAEAEGVLERCEFHEGVLDSLPASAPFDAATCLLVSHFVTELDARRGLFEAIASRLVPGAVLVSADLAGDMGGESFASLLGLWRALLGFAGLPGEEIDKLIGAFGDKVSVLPPAEVAGLIGSAGFEEVVQVFQSGLMHGWMARRRAG